MNFIDETTPDRKQFTPILVKAFWTGVGILFVYVCIATKEFDVTRMLVAGCLAAVVLLPIYLWCKGTVAGIPIFPIFALTHLWGFVFPLVSGSTAVERYGIDAKAEAALTVFVFLAVATLVWLSTMNSVVRKPASFMSLDLHSSDGLLLLFLTFSCLYQMNLKVWWIPVPASLYSVATSASATVAILAIAVLSHNLGRNNLSPVHKLSFILLLVLYIILLVSSLMLVIGLATGFMSVVMYTMASRRPPVLAIVVALVIFAILHLGKHEMRAKYWRTSNSIQPWDYPAFFGEWFGYGLESAIHPLRSADDRRTDQSSLIERAALLQITMLIQSKTPEQLPYLYGETYVIIPPLLVPRFLSPNKSGTHEGTTILTTYYGLQTREDANTTTIGFGIMNESYANFGYVGIVGLGALMGYCLALVTRAALQVPVLSLRGLFAIIVLANVVSLESPASVVVTATFQSAVVLIGIALVLMRREVAASRRLAAKSAEFSHP